MAISRDPKPQPEHKPATVAIGGTGSGHATNIVVNGVTVPRPTNSTQTIIVNPTATAAVVNTNSEGTAQTGPTAAQEAVVQKKQDVQEKVYTDAAEKNGTTVGEEKAFSMMEAQISEGTAPRDAYGNLPVHAVKGSTSWVYPPPPPPPQKKTPSPSPLTRGGSMPTKPTTGLSGSSGGNLTITALAMAAAYLAIG